MTKFSDRLTELRKATGATQEEFCRRLDIPRSTYGGYETGRREPDLDTLNTLADCLNVDLDYLLGNTDKSTLLIQRHELPLTDSERRLLDLYRGLSDLGRGELIGFARRLSEEEVGEKDVRSG